MSRPGKPAGRTSLHNLPPSELFVQARPGLSPESLAAKINAALRPNEPALRAMPPVGLAEDIAKDVQGFTTPFFPEAKITFNVRDTEEHFHVPLVLSPFGYSTYRGS